MKNKKILLAYKGMFHNCPRPKRLYLHLCEKNQVDICSWDTNSIPGVNNFPIVKKSPSPFGEWQRKLILSLKIPFLVKYFAKLDCTLCISDKELEQYDWIFVHDLALLPLFIDHAEKVIFDAREYYPRQFIPENARQQMTLDIYDYYCLTLLHKMPRKITVSQGIADEYKTHYQADFKIFKSYPVQKTVPTSRKVDVDPNKINLIHHGGCMPNRSLEKLIEFGASLGDEYRLYLMLVWRDQAYYNSIVNLASQHDNVILIEPVGFQEIIPFIAQFDIGIHFLEDIEGQHAISLPNKFFEFVAAGLMLLVTGSKEMVTEARAQNLGLAYDGISDLKQLKSELLSLSQEDIASFKRNSLNVAPSYDFSVQFDQLEDALNLS